MVGHDGTTIHLDLGIRCICFAIEANGFGYHASRDDLDRDADRATLIARLHDDWRVVPITWQRWHRHRERVIADVRATIAAQSERLLGLPWPPYDRLVRAAGRS